MVLKSNNIDLDYQVSLDNHEKKTYYTPKQKEIINWIGVVLREIKYKNKVQLTVRVVTEKEMIKLNGTYRQKWIPTNVLAFPFEPLAGVTIALIGDVVICAKIVSQQAVEQQKTHEQHWVHMIIHGVLHLLGFDHQTEEATATMESIEKATLLRLGYPDPYTELWENGCV